METTMMDELDHIQNELDINSALEHLNNEEKLIEQEIDSLLSKDDDIKVLVSSLLKHMEGISLVESDAERLSNLMHFTSKMADDVSYKIKSFDLVKKRVSDCLKQVEDIIDLRSCAEGIQKALAEEDYEDAARLIYRFLSMDESMLRKSASEESGANVDSCSLDQSLMRLHEAEQSLRSIVATRFDEAVFKKDTASVERFFKIFPLIRQHKQGLVKFSNYLWSQIDEESEAKKINAATKSAIALAQLTNLFETIAQKLDVHYPLIETFYGPGNLFQVASILQLKCDQKSKKIIQMFKNEKNFFTLTTSVGRALKNFSFSTSSQSNNAAVTGDRIDPKLVDKHLNDLMFIINRSQTYLNFVNTRCLVDLEAAANNKPLENIGINKEKFKSSSQVHPEMASALKIDSLIRDCDLTQALHELDSNYVLLEEYFLKESVQKAVLLDSVDTREAIDALTVITSSMLDDIFFIIKKCLKRSVSCMSINVILAMINHCVIVLETIFLQVINERIQSGYPSSSTLDLTNAYNALQSGRYLQSSNDVEVSRFIFIASLNNLDVAGEYIDKLCSTITDDVTKSGLLSKKQQQKNQTELFDSCISNMSALNQKFRSLTTTGAHRLFVTVFKPPVKSMIDSFQGSSHQLIEEDLLSHEVTEGLRPFMQTFLVQTNLLLHNFKKQLTEKNFDVLLGVLASEISNRLYKALFKCLFNKFGGFQFDREIRAIINFLSSLSSGSMSREHFSKLKFIGIIFTMENVEEINEFINSEGNYTALRIHPNELHQLLRLNTELSPIEIRKIKI